MRRIRLGSAAAAVCLALLLAACGGGDDALQGGTQPSDSSSVIVGSTNFPEQLILAQMYAAVLEKAGVDVTTRLNLGNREVVFPALEKGEIQLLPEYNGSVLSFLDPKATATTTEEVNTALAPLLQAKNLVALDTSPAEDKDGWAVTQETATKHNLSTLDDLKPVASQLVVGGPAELKTRPAGLPGLKKVYGIPDFKEFKALDPGGPLTISALKKGDIQLLPEYNGSVLSFLDPKATAVTSEEVNTALAPLLQAKNLVALQQSPAEDKDGWAVTKETAAKYNLRTLDDLKPVAGQLVVGGPPELKTRPAGLPGLKNVYGIPDFKEFKALDAGGPLTVSALKKGDIDVGRVFTTQGVIAAEGWVLLEETKPLEPAQNVVPIGRTDAMTDQVKNALNALSGKITTEELTKLNAQVDVDKKDPEQVARDWLTQQGLI